MSAYRDSWSARGIPAIHCGDDVNVRRLICPQHGVVARCCPAAAALLAPPVRPSVDPGERFLLVHGADMPLPDSRIAVRRDDGGRIGRLPGQQHNALNIENGLGWRGRHFLLRQRNS
jgi:hypothetical protein